MSGTAGAAMTPAMLEIASTSDDMATMMNVYFLADMNFSYPILAIPDRLRALLYLPGSWHSHNRRMIMIHGPNIALSAYQAPPRFPHNPAVEVARRLRCSTHLLI